MTTTIRRTRTPQVIEAESVVRVSSSGFCAEEGDRYEMAVHRFQTEPAYVRINHGVTKNQGNYESLRIDVSISVPCYTEELPEVTTRLSDEVSILLSEELKKYGLQP